MANTFTVKIEWCESNVLPVRDYTDTKEIKELEALTARKCHNYPEERGYDKVGFQIFYGSELFYTGKYYVQKNGYSLYQHIKLMLPDLASDDEVIPYIIDVVFGEVEADYAVIDKYLL